MSGVSQARVREQRENLGIPSLQFVKYKEELRLSFPGDLDFYTARELAAEGDEISNALSHDHPFQSVVSGKHVFIRYAGDDGKVVCVDKDSQVFIRQSPHVGERSLTSNDWLVMSDKDPELRVVTLNQDSVSSEGLPLLLEKQLASSQIARPIRNLLPAIEFEWIESTKQVVICESSEDLDSISKEDLADIASQDGSIILGDVKFDVCADELATYLRPVTNTNSVNNLFLLRGVLKEKGFKVSLWSLDQPKDGDYVLADNDWIAISKQDNNHGIVSVNGHPGQSTSEALKSALENNQLKSVIFHSTPQGVKITFDSKLEK
jgi:hypothetical protein